jgi:hypothetical protein
MIGVGMTRIPMTLWNALADCGRVEAAARYVSGLNMQQLREAGGRTAVYEQQFGLVNLPYRPGALMKRAAYDREWDFRRDLEVI